MASYLARVSLSCAVLNLQLARCPSVVVLCLYTVYSKWPLLFEGIACPLIVIQELLAQRHCVSRSGASQHSQGILYSEPFGIVRSRHCVLTSELSVGLLSDASLVDCIVSSWLAIVCG